MSKTKRPPRMVTGSVLPTPTRIVVERVVATRVFAIDWLPLPIGGKDKRSDGADQKEIAWPR